MANDKQSWNNGYSDREQESFKLNSWGGFAVFKSIRVKEIATVGAKKHYCGGCNSTKKGKIPTRLPMKL
jgi:hypothetical protein